ncbi:energy transducer TonB [Thiohalorhabdus sp. Cl-TMA]|uniref:Energy transducer TonB n=1 Tax=Thiohalorhabdus methylotrophus TaxID=3242694 RepID=A0ABV4TZ01_9GAMM
MDSPPPEPLQPRPGRRYLPALVAFVWAVALHVALAAGLVGLPGQPPQLHSGPEGFEVVNLPGKTKPPKPAEKEPTPEAQEPEPETAEREAPEPPPEPRETEPAPQPEPQKTDPDAALPKPEETPPRTKTAEAPLKRKVAPQKPPEPRVAQTEPEKPEPEPDPKPKPKPDPKPKPEPDPKPEPEPTPEEKSQPEEKPSRQTDEPTETTAKRQPQPDKASDQSGSGGQYQAPSANSEYRDNPPPSYPLRARRRALEGTVQLRVRVSPKGEPLEVSVAESSGHAILDRTAKEAVRDWRFEPATRGGQPVEGTVKVPVRFRLSSG